VRRAQRPYMEGAGRPEMRPPSSFSPMVQGCGSSRSIWRDIPDAAAPTREALKGVKGRFHRDEGTSQLNGGRRNHPIKGIPMRPIQTPG